MCAAWYLDGLRDSGGARVLLDRGGGSLARAALAAEFAARGDGHRHGARAHVTEAGAGAAEGGGGAPGVGRGGGRGEAHRGGAGRDGGGDGGHAVCGGIRWWCCGGGVRA